MRYTVRGGMKIQYCPRNLLGSPSMSTIKSALIRCFPRGRLTLVHLGTLCTLFLNPLPCGLNVVYLSTNQSHSVAILMDKPLASISCSFGSIIALLRLLVSTPDSATAAITSSTLLNLFLKFAFLVGESLNGDFLSVSIGLLIGEMTDHSRPLDSDAVPLNAPNISCMVYNLCLLQADRLQLSEPDELPDTPWESRRRGATLHYYRFGAIRGSRA